MRSVRQNAQQYWAFSTSEKEFVESAKNGVAISLVFAFIILLISTQNIIMALLSVLSVAIVIVSVVCIIVMRGWEFGVSESICTVIIIGLSVDYCVHLATEYQHSGHRQRKYKMKQSYNHMGKSIFSGTMTTLGSGVFLFGGKLITFEKFATIIGSTIVISFLVAMLFFGAMMHIMGPTRGCGDLFNSCRDKAEDEEEYELD